MRLSGLVGNQEMFDAVVIDFPDPGTYSVGKLYTTRFFHLLQQRMSPDCVVAIQCTSPLVAPKSFWCIVHTLEAVGFQVRPYRASVPSFGVWGFALASVDYRTIEAPVLSDTNVPLRFLNQATMDALFEIPPDLQRVDTDLNQLNNQILVRYYEQEWSGQG